MWDRRERNMMHPSQSLPYDPVNPEVSSMQHMSFMPSNNGSNGHFLIEASRKRKAIHTDPFSYVHDGVSPLQGNMRDYFGHLPHSHNNVVSPQVVHSQLETPEFFNHNSQSSKPGNPEYQYVDYEYYNSDNSFLRLQTKDENVKTAADDNLNSFRFHHSESSFSSKKPVSEICKSSVSQHLAYDIASQSEPIKFQSYGSYYKKSGDCMEKTESALGPNYAMNLGHGNNNLSSTPILCSSNMPSKYLTVSESCHLRMVNEKFHPDGGTFFQDFSRNGLPEVQRIGHDSRFAEDRNISIGTTTCKQTSACSQGMEAYGSSPYSNTKIRTGNYNCNDILGVCLNVRGKEHSGSIMPQMPVLAESSYCEEATLDDGRLKNTAHVSKDSETKMLEKEDRSNSENKCHSSGEGTLPDSNNSLVKGPVEPGDGLPLNLGEQSKSVAGKVSPMIVEKIWDGSLQLNTSITVSSVAFFKSGEKSQDINWPEHVEIKGKVRLHAFEKFIQELPRSRNRALMVISLCWKVGSSKAGLMGMKEIVKGYKESERVGFAQICPGIDLYVCPRSDTIITILAKYGFFKGMAAVEEDQDSLIGCVVWRRSLSNSTPKISERKRAPLQEQPPLNSPEPSVLEMNNSPPTKLHDSENKLESLGSPLIVETRFAAPENTAISMTESKVTQSSNNSSCDGVSFHSSSVLAVSPLMPCNSPLTPVQPTSSAQKPESLTLQASLKHNEIAESRKFDLGAEPMQLTSPGPPRMFIGLPHQMSSTQNSRSSNNPGSNNSCSVSGLTPSIPLASPLMRAQLPMKQKPDSNSRQESMEIAESKESSTKFELTQSAVSGPPPLPPEVLQRIFQSSKDAWKAPMEGMSKAENTSFMHSTGELKESSVVFETRGQGLPPASQLLPQTKQRPTDMDDDDDLPEFDFHSACGIPDAPLSKCPWGGHQNHFSDASLFNKQLSVEQVKNGAGPMPPPPPTVLPAAKSMKVVQRQQSSGLPDNLSNNSYQGTTTLPAEFEDSVRSEKKPAAALVSQSLSQPWTMKTDKDSSRFSSAQNRSHWADNDDDDMPEWCPPELEPLDQLQQPSSTAKLPSPVILKPVSENNAAGSRPLIPASFPKPSFCPLPPPGQSEGLTLHGYQPGILGPCPANAKQGRPPTGVAQPNPRPPRVPHSIHSSRPQPTKPSGGNRRWRRH